MGVFLMFIQPLFSHDSRFVVKPSWTYLESILICRGQYGAVSAISYITAASSPTQFDYVSPRILRVQFFGLLQPNQIPLLLLTSCLPLFIHALSVYTVISLHRGMGPCGLQHLVIWLVLFVGSINTLKHSARLSLQIMDGLKVTLLLFCPAVQFLIFPDLVSNRLSIVHCCIGLYLGGIRFRHISASAVQSWRCSHPFVLSSKQLWHGHSQFYWWVRCWSRWHILAEVLTRSATLVTLWFCIRHLAVILLRVCCSAMIQY